MTYLAVLMKFRVRLIGRHTGRAESFKETWQYGDLYLEDRFGFILKYLCTLDSDFTASMIPNFLHS